MFLLSDIITYVRRIIKSPSNAQVTDALIIDYINRFWITDLSARMQAFDLKNKYQLQLTPGVDKYNMPLYSVQTEPGAQAIASFPVYQGFLGPCYINGVQVPLYTQKQTFFNIWMNIVQYQSAVALGDGVTTTFQINMPILPNFAEPINPPFNGLLRGHVDINGIITSGTPMDPPVTNAFIANIPSTSVESQIFITSIDNTGANIVVADSGQFLEGNVNYGLLMTPGQAPFGNAAQPGGYSTTVNTVNYFTGVANVTFNTPPAAGANINAQCFYFNAGLPRGVLFYNNVLTFRSPPSSQFLAEFDCYLSPAAFLNTSGAIPFGYMAEYIARGAARKMLSDTGDMEQFQFYEPLFKEQELLVWKRSQREWTSTRTETIYSTGLNQGQGGFNNGGTSI